MGVFNGAERVAAAAESILRQDGVRPELIVVNDGSTDGTAEILEACAARDPRVRIIHQANAGLTHALIRGCREANGAFIARQDADDVSLPGRLRKQVERLAARPQESLVSCWTRFVGPAGEELYVAQPEDDPEQGTRSLRATDLATLRGISSHGSALFRREDYQRAGGYRGQFYFAQDLDLWLRLTDRGLVGFVPEVLYELRFTPTSISMRYRAQQLDLTRVAMALTAVRQRGGDEWPLLARAAAIRPTASRPASAADREKGLYFIGRCLLDRGDRRASRYFRAAIRQRPLSLRAWVGLGRAACRA